MSILTLLIKNLTYTFSSIGKTFSQPSFWALSDALGSVSNSGTKVTHQNALGVSAYYSGVTRISQTVAQLPLILYRREARGKARAIDEQLYSVLHDEPNPYMTAFTFRETLQGHLLTWGNAFAEIEWDMSGSQPVAQALYPLRPDQMQLELKNGEVVYRYTVPSGETVTLSSKQVLHIPGFGFDGLIGYDPITLHREALGLSKACEEFGARFFKNGSSLRGVISLNEVLRGEEGKKAHERMRESWDTIYSGLSNSHRVAILEGGASYKDIGIPPNNAQFLETRNFQVLEVARMLNIPPHKLGHLSDATFSNIEHQNIEFVVDTLQPWLKRWEQEIRRKLIFDRAYFAEFLVDGLLRGDIKSRYEAYSIGREKGWLSANDVRELENMNPIDGGDIYMVPLNMMPANMVTDVSTEKSMKAMSDIANRRAAQLRKRTAERYRPALIDVMQRAVAHEARKVKSAAHKHLSTKDSLTLQAWLQDFYGDSFRKYLIDRIGPVLRSLAEAVHDEAAREVDGERELKDDNAVSEYVDDFARRYAVVHQAQVEEAMKADDALASIDELMDEWPQVAPHKVAVAETVKLSNEIAVMAFAAVGIRKYIWRTVGSDTCPICMEWDGVEVTTMRPPLHDGCECQLSPR